MRRLSLNWFAEGLIDFEYKQYVLLAYLKEIRAEFSRTRLYPALGDLAQRRQSLRAYAEGKKGMQEAFPKKVKDLDPLRREIVWETLVEDDALMRELDAIVAFALPRVEAGLAEGKELWQEISEALRLEPVGLAPIYKSEGYLLASFANRSDVYVYQYETRAFYTPGNTYRGAHTRYVTSYSRSLTCTYEHIKLDLARNGELPNPATYLVETPADWPLHATTLPLAKQQILRLTAERGERP